MFPIYMGEKERPEGGGQVEGEGEGRILLSGKPLKELDLFRKMAEYHTY